MDSSSSDAAWAPQSPDLSTYHSSDIDTQPVHPQHQGYRGSISLSSPTLLNRSLPSQQPQHHQQHQHQHQHPPPPPPVSYMPRGAYKEDAEYLPDTLHFSEKSIGKRPLDMTDPSAAGAAANGGGLAALDSVKISHHFPVARIKRIMQADDDVGKVAQVTPVVVSKALELFMVSLVTKAAAEAKARNSKRVGALHLKQAITKNEQFDFLNDIVSKVADAPAAGDKGDGDSMEVDGKKKKGPGRRKKKTDDDDF